MGNIPSSQALKGERADGNCTGSDQLLRRNRRGNFGVRPRGYQFEQKPLKLLMVNDGYHTVQYTLYGLILGLWH
jgi:hypothetical protein